VGCHYSAITQRARTRGATRRAGRVAGRRGATPGDGGERGRLGLRGPEPETAVWSVRVVVADILTQHPFQLAAVHDEDRVQALPAQRADRAFADRVGPGRPHRRADHRRPSERNPVSNDPAKSAFRSWRRNFRTDNTSPVVIARLRACWVTYAAVGWAVTPARCIRRVSSSMKTNTYSRRKKTVSTVRKSAASMCAA
jgi:hypothetical protein